MTLVVAALLPVVLVALVVASVWLGMVVEAQRAISWDDPLDDEPVLPAAEVIDLRCGSDGVWTADQ